jgi:hypothetical protein
LFPAEPGLTGGLRAIALAPAAAVARRQGLQTALERAGRMQRRGPNGCDGRNAPRSIAAGAIRRVPFHHVRGLRERNMASGSPATR